MIDSQPRSSPTFTQREWSILEHVSAGCSNREVADILEVTVKDVEYHVGNLIRKLGCRNRTEAVSLAYARGYLSAGSWPPQAVRARASEETQSKVASSSEADRERRRKD